jgi:CRISPR-associated RAMP protein (TIGR02581 family)
MLKRLVNECRFTLAIHTEGPVLVKSGHATVSGPDMTPVLTYRNGNTEVYLPGSSLKGVFRSHAEKVIRTLNDVAVCNPFVKTEDRAQRQGNQLVCPDYAEVSCSDKFEVRQKDKLQIGDFQRGNPKEDLSNEQAYRDSCPACRLFGSTSFIGRVAISDAYLAKDSQQKTEQRDGVGIDRFTGGAAGGAKFDLEVVSSGVTFETNIYMRNFEVWQLGMLMLIVTDLEDGLIRIGSGRSRGLGNVKGKISEVSVNYLGTVNGKPSKDVWGLGKLLGNNSYGTDANDQVTIQSPPTEVTRGIRKITTFKNNSLDALKQAAVESFVNKIQSWNVPQTMQFEHLQFQQIGGNE